MSKKEEKPDFSKLKPYGSYLSSLSDFADLMDSMNEADEAAKKLLEETDGAAGVEKTPQEAEKKAEDTEKKRPDADELLKELDSLTGLEKIKRNVHSLINLVKVRKLREEKGLPVPPMSLHLVFMGNPGTGKTTVARLIAQLYFAIGVLSRGQLVEVDRSGLVAGFVGQTAMKTSEAVKSAIGGVLFIDEAYSLAESADGTNDFGREAIETLLKAMEDNRGDLVVIVAGYEKLMEKFISSNPGLESRFNRYFLFEDYNGDELYEIFMSMCVKGGYKLSPEAEDFMKKHLQYIYDTRDENFGNARDVRNIFENIISVQADRLAKEDSPTADDLMTVTKEDAEAAVEM